MRHAEQVPQHEVTGPPPDTWHGDAAPQPRCGARQIPRQRLWRGLGLTLLLASASADARLSLEDRGQSPVLEDDGGDVGLVTLPTGPAPADCRHPAALIIHDTPGPDLRSTPYAEQLLAGGLVLLELAADPGVLRGEDVLRGYAALARHPSVDADRIGLLAFGGGARVALLATQTEDPFAARVVLYPGCAALLQDLPATTPRPHGRLMLTHGGADPANTIAACAALARRLSGGQQKRLRAFRDASYAWDFPSMELLSPWLYPMPGGADRATIRPWPALAALSAAEAASFLAGALRSGGL